MSIESEAANELEDQSIKTLRVGDTSVVDVFNHIFAPEEAQLESYDDYLEFCNFTGRAVRYSEIEFLKMKRGET